MTPDQFRRLADHFAEPALLLTNDGTILAANRAIGGLGHSASTLAGRSLADLSATPVEAMRDYLRRCSRSGESVLGVLDLVDGDGRTVRCRCHGAVLERDPERQRSVLLLRLEAKDTSPSRFGILNQQIEELTEEIRRRKAAEERVQEQREWLSVTLSSIGDAVITTDESAQVTFLNPVAEGLTGWTNADAQGHPLEDVFRIVNEYTRRPVANPARKVLEDGVIVGLANHTVLIAKDGTERPIDDSGAPIRSADGRIAGVVLVFRDVTERKETEQALLASEQRFRGLMEQAPFSVQVFSADGRVVRVNRAWENLWGLTLDQVSEYNILEDRQLEAKGVLSIIRAAFQGEPVQVPAIGYDPNDTIPTGSRHEKPIRWVAAVAYPLKDDAGRVREVVLVHDDMTARIMAENELREADRRKDEFLAMLAHELRNPLAPIRSGLDLLGMLGTDEQIVGPMQQQVTHLVRLVDDLLDVSRIMRGKVELRKEMVDLSTIVERAVRTALPLIDALGHEFIEERPAEPVALDADPVRLAQVLSNLLNNAAKYTENGGRIRLSAKAQGDQAVITVGDTGIGIEPALLSKVFDLFTQAERTIDRSQGGLGIGLTLVKNLVELHGGSVTAHSAGLGQGSTFVVRLPLGRPTATPDADGTPPNPTGSYCILVVDDNISAAKLLAMLLTRLGGHEVVLAHDGPSALAAASAHRPDIILLDIGLPRMDGYEVARRLRQQPEFGRTLVVALTGYGTEEDRRKSLHAGCDDHLVKPPSVDAIKQVLAHPNLPRR